MHRPLHTARAAEVPGSVQRIDDPHPVGCQAGRVIAPLFGQDGIGGSKVGKAGHQVLMGPTVALVLELPRGPSGRQALVQNGEEHVTGLLGQQPGQFMILHRRPTLPVGGG